MVAGGCFTGEYGRRMDQTISTLAAQGAKAAAVWGDPTSVSDSGISLRLPVFVDDKSAYLEPTSPNAQPPFYNLPGFSNSYEIPFDGVPAYVYLAAVKADEKPTDALAQEVQAGVGRTFSSAVWQDVTLETFSGGSMAVKKLSAIGPQVFGGEKADGQFDLYMVSSGSHNVLIGWRAAAATAVAHEFFEKAAISMGTVAGTL